MELDSWLADDYFHIFLKLSKKNNKKVCDCPIYSETHSKTQQIIPKCLNSFNNLTKYPNLSASLRLCRILAIYQVLTIKTVQSSGNLNYLRELLS